MKYDFRFTLLLRLVVDFVEIHGYRIVMLYTMILLVSDMLIIIVNVN